MKRASIIGLLLLVGCAAARPAQQVDAMPDPGPEVAAPTGATIEPSGFATILSAPPAPIVAEPRVAGPKDETGFYAREYGISNAEAAKRIAEQRAAFPAYERLLGQLRAKEKGNFTDARMIHRPDWAYVFYFKRDPAATLARYTKHPHFKAAQARYTREELDALVKPWAERFGGAGILGGYGSDATFGEAEMMLSVSEAEYRELLKQVRWPELPDAIKLKYSAPLVAPRLDPRAEPLLRAFVSEPRSTVIQLTALGGGRIVLKDGCLRVVQPGGGESLAIFHRETGVGFDAAGYLVLVDRLTGKPTARIGEAMVWGGPNGEGKGVPGVAELQARCGGGAVLNVGNPQSAAAFNAKYHRN